MKKTLLSLLAAVAFGFAASADEVTFDFTTNAYGCTVAGPANTNYNSPDGTELSESVITLTMNNLTGYGCRFWKTKAGAQTFRANKNSGFTVSINGGTITKIAFTGSKLTGVQADGNALTDNAWSGSAASVAFVSTIEAAQFKTMVVTYTGGAADTRKDAGMSFPEAKYTVEMGKAFTAPVLTKATNAAVTYASDKETVATVDAATGAVTIVGEGTARITATAAENTEYKAGTASYLLTVVAAAPENAIYWSELGADFTFEMNDIEGLEGRTVWQHDKTYGLKASAYVNGIHAVQALAVSPEIDLTNATSAKLDFKNAFNNYKLNNEMIQPSEFDNYAMFMIAESGKLLDNPEPQALITPPTAFSWNFYNNASISLDQYVGKKIQFAFLYISTEEVAGTWEVKNIAVTGDKSGIAGIEAEANAPVEYFNLQGVRVANPENGLFIRRQGNTVTKVLVK